MDCVNDTFILLKSKFYKFLSLFQMKCSLLKYLYRLKHLCYLYLRSYLTFIDMSEEHNLPSGATAAVITKNNAQPKTPVET